MTESQSLLINIKHEQTVEYNAHIIIALLKLTKPIPHTARRNCQQLSNAKINEHTCARRQ